MSITLITGGVRSGKSSYAEARIKANGYDALYIATAIAGDDEMRERVAAHRAARPATWPTWETHRDLHTVASVVDPTAYRAILLDCVSNLLTFVWFDEISAEDGFSAAEVDAVERICCAELDAIAAFAREYDKDLLLVTNEVGWGIVPPSALGRAYRDTLGRLNQHCAQLADEVILLVSGIPLRIK
ncbi:MAG: bifunctional adenosylcobinamide kinase/adenosylcobinamide-phosphate guanylyltransferase [Propionibacteriaceae bacterium]|jgi:adenosylcobinamide kinase/adenosylcobinamide-phosphate guanylyltransferase|nr:bifunctional adenosylcobinamide kinase/adenosylcobinamide-phosphate guanylyltransferase [Propionibacteriaceae bacterium]